MRKSIRKDLPSRADYTVTLLAAPLEITRYLWFRWAFKATCFKLSKRPKSLDAKQVKLSQAIPSRTALAHPCLSIICNSCYIYIEISQASPGL